MFLNSFILTQNQKQLMIQKPKTAEKQNVHKSRARKNMATKINDNAKRQQMNKPIMDSFYTNSYNNKKNNYQRIKPPQNHSSQFKNKSKTQKHIQSQMCNLTNSRSSLILSSSPKSFIMHLLHEC
jgi:hypothetical protein